MVKILHGGSGHAHHNCSHNHSTSEISQVTYEMEEIDIGNIEIGNNDKDADETLGLRHNDSLDVPEVVGQFSKSFDRGSDKLDPESQQDMNRSTMQGFNSTGKFTSNNTSHDFKDISLRSFKNGHAHGMNANDNLNVRAAAIHIIGDIIQSVGVLLAAMIIYMFPGSDIIDPI